MQVRRYFWKCAVLWLLQRKWYKVLVHRRWGNTFVLFGPDQGELAYPAHHMVLETTSRNQSSELSGATMIPQMTVVADLTRSGD